MINPTPLLVRPALLGESFPHRVNATETDPETRTTAVVAGYVSYSAGLRAVGFVYRPDAETLAYLLERPTTSPSDRHVDTLGSDLAFDLARDPEADGWTRVEAVRADPIP